ncbi:hypothetical protein KR215_011236 [Drosophila sulfurigaster]|nr:hypothetical protein KR215_011236 [Drosophila sulfurigaster]
MAMADVMSKFQQQQQHHQQQQQQQQQQQPHKPLGHLNLGHDANGLLLTNMNGNNNSNSNSNNGVSSSISNLLISNNSHNNSKVSNAWSQPMAQAEAISALWGCASNASTTGSTSGCSSGSGSQPSLSPTSSHSKELLWAQTSPNCAQLRENFYAAKELLPHAASPTASLTSSSGASSTGGWGTTSNVAVNAHYAKLSAAQNIWELPPANSSNSISNHNSHNAAQLAPDMFSDLLCNLHIGQDGNQHSNNINNISSNNNMKADANSDVSSNSSSSAGELEVANIWRHSTAHNVRQVLFEEPTGVAPCMQLFNDYLNMN